MFKPQRLIYREMGDYLSEGIPDALESTLNYVPKTGEKAFKEIQEVSSGISKAVKGVLKGTGRIWNFLGKKVLWQDVAALPKEAAMGWGRNLKSMTVETVKSGWKGNWKEAGKSFLGGVFGAVTVTPLKAIWKGLKGAVNIPLRVAYAPVEAVKVAGEVAGLSLEGGGLTTKSYGVIPAMGSIVKGTVGVATAPLYPITERSTVPGWGKKFMDGALAFPMDGPTKDAAA